MGKKRKVKSHSWSKKPPKKKSDEEEKLWAIEKIVDCRQKKDKTFEFLISWKDCDESQNTWEPEENLTVDALKDAQPLMDDYLSMQAYKRTGRLTSRKSVVSANKRSRTEGGSSNSVARKPRAVQIHTLEDNSDEETPPHSKARARKKKPAEEKDDTSDEEGRTPSDDLDLDKEQDRRGVEDLDRKRAARNSSADAKGVEMTSPGVANVVDRDDEADRLIGLLPLIHTELKTKLLAKHPATIDTLSSLFPESQFPKLNPTSHCVICHESYDPRIPEKCKKVHNIKIIQSLPELSGEDEVFKVSCDSCEVSWEASERDIDMLRKSNCFECPAHSSEIQDDASPESFHGCEKCTAAALEKRQLQ